MTTDLSRVVREAKQNVNFRKDKSAIVHVGLGKVQVFLEICSETMINNALFIFVKVAYQFNR